LPEDTLLGKMGAGLECPSSWNDKALMVPVPCKPKLLAPRPGHTQCMDAYAHVHMCTHVHPSPGRRRAGEGPRALCICDELPGIRRLGLPQLFIVLRGTIFPLGWKSGSILNTHLPDYPLLICCEARPQEPILPWVFLQVFYPGSKGFMSFTTS
jgi:hypothetical protein